MILNIVSSTTNMAHPLSEIIVLDAIANDIQYAIDRHAYWAHVFMTGDDVDDYIENQTKPHVSEAEQKQLLLEELEDSFREIELAMESVARIAKEWGCKPHEARNTNGELMWTPLITAKANVLIAIKELKYG